MRIVIPVSASDVHLLDKTMQVDLMWGHLESHHVTFSPAQSVLPQAEAMAEEFISQGYRADVLTLPFEGDGRWPQAPNMHWAMTMQALAHAQNQDPIFWKELDCISTDPFWADRLETGWRAGRMAFHAKIVPKPSRNTAGAIIFEPDDLMGMGCAVYPANICQLRNWDVMVRAFLAGTEEEPFDVFMRGWMRAIGWSDATTIGDRWNTVGYKMENGILTCRPGPTQFKGRDHSKTDVSGCVVVHGCKDNSLADLIIAQGGITLAPVPQQGFTPAVHAPIQIPTSTVPRHRNTDFRPIPPPGPDLAEIHQRIDALREEVAFLKKCLSDLQALFDEHTRRLTTLETKPAELPPTPRGEPMGDTPAVNGTNGHDTPEDLLPRIRGIVNERNVRACDVATELSMDKERIKAIIERPDSQISYLRGGWLTLTE